MNAPSNTSRSLRTLAVAAAIAAALGAIAIRPALADDDDQGWDHGYHRGWYHHHRAYIYEPYAPPVVVYPQAPAYVYEPPPVVYAPPPVVYAPAPFYASPSINFVFPLHVR